MAEWLILITGGARSGKSSNALALAAAHTPKIFIATATASDDEMRARIARHQAERGSEWTTIEEPLDLAGVLRTHRDGVAVVDCVTLWIANAMEANLDMDTAVTDFLAAVAGRSGPVVVVTNEVGLGVVPAFPSGRRFRDLAGIVNQRLAAAADIVLLMVSGLQLRLKG